MQTDAYETHFFFANSRNMHYKYGEKEEKKCAASEAS